MSKLWRKLPPPAPDTSGVANVFYGMNGLLVFNDVQGCATNYCIYDESRTTIPVNVFPAQLANIDVIMGAGGQLRRMVSELYKNAPEAEFIALAGSPISAFIGTDLVTESKLIADEIGLPVIPVDVTGHRHYDTGASQALLTLGQYLLKGERMGIKRSVNILGTLTMDFGTENIEAIRNYFEQNGYSVLSMWGYSRCLADFRKSVNASFNIVVSHSGLRLAKEMKKTYGIPFVMGVPCGERWSAEILKAINSGQTDTGAQCRRNERILVIGEQILSNSIRNMLRYDYSFEHVSVAGLFEMDSDYMEPDDRKLDSEKDLQYLMDGEDFDIIIGDPFFERFSGNKSPAPAYIPLPHIAVSSRIYESTIPKLIGKSGNVWFDSVLRFSIKTSGRETNA